MIFIIIEMMITKMKPPPSRYSWWILSPAGKKEMPFQPFLHYYICIHREKGAKSRCRWRKSPRIRMIMGGEKDFFFGSLRRETSKWKKTAAAADKRKKEPTHTMKERNSLSFFLSFCPLFTSFGVRRKFFFSPYFFPRVCRQKSLQRNSPIFPLFRSFSFLHILGQKIALSLISSSISISPGEASAVKDIRYTCSENDILWLGL